MSCGGPRGGDLGHEDIEDPLDVRTIDGPTPSRSLKKARLAPTSTTTSNVTHKAFLSRQEILQPDEPQEVTLDSSSKINSTHSSDICKVIETSIAASLEGGVLRDIPVHLEDIGVKLKCICDMLIWLSEEEDSREGAAGAIPSASSFSSPRPPGSMDSGGAIQMLAPSTPARSIPSTSMLPTRLQMVMPSTQWATTPWPSSTDPRSLMPQPYTSRYGTEPKTMSSSASHVLQRIRQISETTSHPNPTGNGGPSNP